MKVIVDFHTYCSKCKFKDCSEDDIDSPCYECLQYSWNEDSSKPQLYEER